MLISHPFSTAPVPPVAEERAGGLSLALYPSAADVAHGPGCALLHLASTKPSVRAAQLTLQTRLSAGHVNC